MRPFYVRFWMLQVPLAVLAYGCAAPTESGNPSEINVAQSATRGDARIAACNSDPRVVTGLVSARICAGANIFLHETFNGNGRTCATCHPMGHNTTIDRDFINTLSKDDPLFVFEPTNVNFNPAIAQLETPDLRAQGGVLENVDGSRVPGDATTRFVVRGVPHVLSLKISLAPDVDEPTPPNDRTGWSGDGSPGTGTLREFLSGAVAQHYTKSLDRNAGTDFRVPDPDELDLVAEFQLALGRTNELDFTQVNLADPDANDGRLAYMDPNRGRCNFCHLNGGANFQLTGKNRNFDTGTRLALVFNTFGRADGNFLFDGGFGGQTLDHPNFDAFKREGQPAGTPNSFGDGTFNTTPVIEAVDTAPFFHTNAFSDTIEAAIAFYTGPQFQASPAETFVTAQFGTPINFPGEDISKMGRFLRTLNAAFNLDIAKQRLEAAQTLVNRFQDQFLTVQTGLMQLADTEINDAVNDLTHGAVQPFYPVSQDRLGLAKQEIDAGIHADTASHRQAHISTAISRVQNARDQFGANIRFNLGQGNLMF
jgi:hypothetical protein